MQVQVLPKFGKKRYGGVAVKTLTQFWGAFRGGEDPCKGLKALEPVTKRGRPWQADALTGIDRTAILG